MRKSDCCVARTRRFGARRRQCCRCLRTWRIRTKRRGRPGLRSDPRLIDRVFRQRRSLTELARNRGVSRQALSHRFLTELARQFKRKPKPDAALGGAILIGDGLWFRFQRRPWVAYLMALRPLHGNRATFLDPFILAGNESQPGWERALDTIPARQRCRVRALVVDDFAGCVSLAKRNGWVLQLCQFHLLARLRARLGYRHPRNVSARPLRQHAYRLVRTALDTDDLGHLEKTLEELKSVWLRPELPWKYRNVLRQFARRINEYRAYRIHPHLNLPRTTGSAESMGRVIRDLMRRTRSLSTPKSLKLWMTNYIRIRPDITCNAAPKSTN